ncbi:hypothetical protein HA402_014409 [Bradysia odoriphaga]|nr:hypothetical protein HA402_014409 [Bradysia odoriphaga]
MDLGYVDYFKLLIISNTGGYYYGLACVLLLNNFADEEILFRRNGDLIKYDMSNGNSQVFLEADVYNNWVSPSFTYSTDYTKLLVRFNVTYVFRHSIVAQYDVYDIASKTITRVGNGEPLNFCVLSPNGNLVAFVKDNNVFTQTINGDEIQLTNDGINGVVYNGVPDWVYEEEVLGSGGALWFSPSGNKIAIASFDDTDVEEFTYVMYENQYEKEERLRYPKHQVEKVTDDHILYSVNWITDDVVGAFWLNRRQNLGSYQICSTIGSRNCYEAFDLSEPGGWVEISAIRCTASGNPCFFIGFGNGLWRSIQRFNLNSPDEPPSTMFPNNSTVLSLYGFSDDGSDVYFTSTLPGQPNAQHIFKNDKCLSCDIVGPEDELCEFSRASFSKSFTYFAFTCAGPGPSYTRIYRTDDGTELLIWEENTISRITLEEYQRPHVHFENVTVTDGFVAIVKLTLPPEIDMNNCTYRHQISDGCRKFMAALIPSK